MVAARPTLQSDTNIDGGGEGDYTLLNGISSVVCAIMPIDRLSTGAAFERHYGYSRAVRAGSLIFVSGTTSADDALGGDIATQFASAVDRVQASLAAFGASRANIVRTVLYIRDIGEIDAISAAHLQAFADFPPASTIVEVSGLVPREARVELEVTAVLKG